MGSISTCPASEAFYHTIMGRAFSSSFSINTGFGYVSAIFSTAYQVSAYITKLAWAILSYPLNLAAYILFSPISWFWRVFVATFETVITPIFYFAAIAGFIGAMGGLVVGGLALLVQWLIPLKKSDRPRSSPALLPSLEPKKALEANNRTRLKDSRAGHGESTTVRLPRTFTAASPPVGEQVTGYEDEDGYSAYTPRKSSLPATPPNEATFVQYFGTIREEDFEDGSNATAMTHRGSVHSTKSASIY